MPTTPNTPCVLIIRDGWGENPNPEHDSFNAVKIARTPVADRLMREYPTTLVATSGFDVGLPEETMGNSEVGHQNIGAGRIVNQESVRITKACRDGSIAQNETITAAIDHAKRNDRFVHLMGIASDAGVHGLLEHLYALLRVCRERGHTKVAIHLFTDGRDTGPFTGKAYVEQVERFCRDEGIGRVASVMGRYWAMDRDNRWERVERAYRCLTGYGLTPEECPVAQTGVAGLEYAYEHPHEPTMKGDEFVMPTLIGSDTDDAMSMRIRDGDSVIFYNYRGDRPREICAAFLMDEFEGRVKPSPDTGKQGFDRGPKLKLHFVLMTPYSEELATMAPVAYPKPPRMSDIAGAYWSELGLRQFRCAETEKFPHVTFFFNDYRDEPFEGESREMIQSPKVSTYDQQPEMSAHGVRDAVLRRLDADDCEPFIVVNFANGDMVGHTGSLEAAVKACEVVDECVGRIIEKALARGGSLIVTADHGNAEQMWDPANDSPHTAHTTYDVPLIVVGKEFVGRTLRDGGRLADIVPTMLEMTGLEQPEAMTGASLLA
ncbi:MAG: 2,3-bisphosphoglycerate-independent phosphoglycerate mutase [Phycisphaeraceae bacterium]|nr:MAG: 2,3-bisphosphoglycerate-independent phosphoglycerate mutase [Phycisphaeraceae bacterium]